MNFDLPKECLNLPDKIKSELRIIFQKYSKLEWFMATLDDFEKCKQAENLVRKYLECLLEDVIMAKRFGIEWIDGNWELADRLEKKRNPRFVGLWNEAGAEAYRIAQNHNREDAYEAVREAVVKIVPRPKNPNRDNELDAWEGIQIMANFAASIIIKDITRTVNLNEPLVELYFMGFWPRGIIQNEFIIFAPIKSNKKLKDKNVNKSFLYKYKSMADDQSKNFLKQVIVNNSIFFASPTSFNDPSEFRFSTALDASGEEKRNWLIGLIQRKNPETSYVNASLMADELFINLAASCFIDGVATWEEKARQSVEQSNKEHIGVLSLTEKNNDILMWSHYADYHRGICVEFNVSKDTQFFKKLYPVKYSDTFPCINQYTSSAVEQLETICLTKAKEWEYEKEWRVLKFENGMGLHKFKKECLTGVILGARISNEDRDLITNWIYSNGLDITLYEARLRPEQYSIKIHQIS